MRNAVRGAIAGSCLFLWGCCNCPDNPVSPTATVTPTPAPTPTATPSTTTCTLPPVNVDVHRCGQEPPPKFQADVIRAQDQVKREHPDIFDGSGRVVSQETYTGWVATVLRGYGYCAIGGTDDEISIKNTNDFSELYDLVTSQREVWNNYVFTCRPPLF